MKKLFVVLAVLASPLLMAAKCEGPTPSGVILNIYRPPSAQTGGCKDGQWLLSVLNNDIANDKGLSVDQKAAKAQKVCLPEKEASKYVVNGQYP